VDRAKALVLSWFGLPRIPEIEGIQITKDGTRLNATPYTTEHGSLEHSGTTGPLQAAPEEPYISSLLSLPERNDGSVTNHPGSLHVLSQPPSLSQLLVTSSPPVQHMDQLPSRSIPSGADYQPTGTLDDNRPWVPLSRRRGPGEESGPERYV